MYICQIPQNEESEDKNEKIINHLSSNKQPQVLKGEQELRDQEQQQQQQKFNIQNQGNNTQIHLFINS